MYMPLDDNFPLSTMFWRSISAFITQGLLKWPSSGVSDWKQCFWTAVPWPGTGPWHQLYRATRGSPRIRHFSFL